ncbi:MAG: VPLPA-CTERM sorting domain-containing protein [Paracoccaceae bacterium]
MRYSGSIFAAAALMLSTVSGQAATVDGASFGAPALGEVSHNTSFVNPTTQLFKLQTGGTLDSYSMWIDTASNFFFTPEDLVFVALRNGTSFPSADDEIGRVNFANADLLAGPKILGSGGQTYVEATWDMSGLGLDVTAGETLGFRIFSSGTGGVVQFNGSSCGNGSGTLDCDPAVGTTRFVGTQTSVGNSGSPVSIGTFQLLVDDGTGTGPAPVPLPAGLPLLLLGLGSLVAVRRRT